MLELRKTLVVHRSCHANTDRVHTVGNHTLRQLLLCQVADKLREADPMAGYHYGEVGRRTGTVPIGTAVVSEASSTLTGRQMLASKLEDIQTESSNTSAACIVEVRGQAAGMIFVQPRST
jgi:hypothetical protein